MVAALVWTSLKYFILTRNQSLNGNIHKCYAWTLCHSNSREQSLRCWLGLTKGIRRCKSTADSSVEKNFSLDLCSTVKYTYLGLVTVRRWDSEGEFFTLVISSPGEFLVKYRFYQKNRRVLRRMHSCVLLLTCGMRTLQRCHINAKGKITKWAWREERRTPFLPYRCNNLPSVVNAHYAKFIVFTARRHASAVSAVVVYLPLSVTSRFSDAEDLGKTQSGLPPTEAPNVDGYRLKLATFDK